MQFIVGEIEREIGYLEFDGRLLGITATERGDPCHQFLHREGLRQIVIGSEREPVDPVVQFATRRQDQDAAVNMRFAEATQNIKPIDARQHHIQNDEFVAMLLRVGQGRLAIVHHHCVMTGVGECTGNMTGEANFIFNHEDVHAF